MARGGGFHNTVKTRGQTNAPTSYGGLTVWLDAADLVDAPAGDLDEWVCKAQGTVFTPSVTNSPELELSRLNGLPCVIFDAVNNDRLSALPAKQIAGTNGEITVFCVAEKPQVNEGPISMIHTTGGDYVRAVYRNPLDLRFQVRDGFTTKQTTVTPGNANNFFTVFAGGHDTESRYVMGADLTDGTPLYDEQAEDFPVVLEDATATVGGDNAGTATVTVCEYIVYNRKLTKSEAQSVIDYLTHKWFTKEYATFWEDSYASYDIDNNDSLGFHGGGDIKAVNDLQGYQTNLSGSFEPNAPSIGFDNRLSRKVAIHKGINDALINGSFGITNKGVYFILAKWDVAYTSGEDSLVSERGVGVVNLSRTSQNNVRLNGSTGFIDLEVDDTEEWNLYQIALGHGVGKVFGGLAVNGGNFMVNEVDIGTEVFDSIIIGANNAQTAFTKVRWSALKVFNLTNLSVATALPDLLQAMRNETGFHKRDYVRT